jgi:hypothetical protein
LIADIAEEDPEFELFLREVLKRDQDDLFSLKALVSIGKIKGNIKETYELIKK